MASLKKFQSQKLYGSANPAHLRLAVTCVMFVLSKLSPEFAADFGRIFELVPIAP